ncbi:hypothetical protein GCM10022233_53030 [Streptomyces shaanxiensis]|uniref:Uncharacterized protein n=1 Tax=Streptomyces shaanxiensis TaxID=653357 RepID=A0ABP7VLQ3_9ACTN
MASYRTGSPGSPPAAPTKPHAHGHDRGNTPLQQLPHDPRQHPAGQKARRRPPPVREARHSLRAQRDNTPPPKRIRPQGGTPPNKEPTATHPPPPTSPKRTGATTATHPRVSGPTTLDGTPPGRKPDDGGRPRPRQAAHTGAT